MSTEKNDHLKPISDPYIIRSGRLKVGDGHELYWVDWGNKAVKNPIFYLHGGPGEGFSERQFAKFNPSRHRVVFHDQRGAGRSTPFASTKANTTADLISDITKLREHLGFDQISLWGISWGSALSLLYAIEHSDAIEKMLIGGVFLARRADNDFYLRGRIASHFPEVWEQFSGPVPKAQDPGQFYKSQLEGSDEAARKRFAKLWMMYESSIVKLDYVPAGVERDLANFASESLAYLEAHYILSDCFIPENYILDHATQLQRVPQIVIVQGRYDFVCPPSAAYELKRSLGDNALLHFTLAGHSSGDTVNREVLRAYTNMMW
jgi:proline iminopeptidase